MAQWHVSKDAQGKPVSISQDNGFMQSSGPYREEEHGWTQTQLDPDDFPAIQTGDDMRALVNEVNRLRKQLWERDGEVKQWRSAAGFP